MHLAAGARDAYQRSIVSTGDARSVEAEAIMRVTAELSRAIGARDHDHPGFVAALSRNARLWTAFAVDVAGDHNALPQATRRQIFAIAEFVRRHSASVLRGDDVDPAPLVDINRNILAGLRRRPDAPG